MVTIMKQSVEWLSHWIPTMLGRMYEYCQFFLTKQEAVPSHTALTWQPRLWVPMSLPTVHARKHQAKLPLSSVWLKRTSRFRWAPSVVTQVTCHIFPTFKKKNTIFAFRTECVPGNHIMSGWSKQTGNGVCVCSNQAAVNGGVDWGGGIKRWRIWKSTTRQVKEVRQRQILHTVSLICGFFFKNHTYRNRE